MQIITTMNKAEVFDSIVKERRSIRVYKSDIPVPDEVMKRSLERTILSPNSSNMQLWEFLDIKDKETKIKVAEFCLGQSTAATAQRFLVIVARPDRYKKSIKLNLENINDPDSFENEKSKKGRRLYYGKIMPLFYAPDPFRVFSFIKKSIVFFTGLKGPTVREVSEHSKKVAIHKSLGIAAQTFMLSMTSEGFDTCPMEGFDSKRMKKLLNLNSSAEINMIISIGKRDDGGIFYPRVRFPFEEVVRTI